MPGGADMDWDALRGTIVTAARFLDDVLDVNHYPTATIKERSLGNRKIGLGLMGFADTLIMLGIRYDSDQAADLAGRIAKLLSQTARQASQDLAKTRPTVSERKRRRETSSHPRPSAGFD